jgi:type I restriction-modification system DNA methylase subunit
MALKKSELYSSLWSSCDELRGGMDASQYKDYVLVLLFIKYVSDKYAGQPYAPIASYEDSTIATYRNRISSARVRSIVFVAPGSPHGSSSVTRTSHCSG